jgi:hypothetical protein
MVSRTLHGFFFPAPSKISRRHNRSLLDSNLVKMVEKLYISYNHVHKLCQEAAEEIKKFKPTLMIAIGM